VLGLEITQGIVPHIQSDSNYERAKGCMFRLQKPDMFAQTKSNIRLISWAAKSGFRRIYLHL